MFDGDTRPTPAQMKATIEQAQRVTPGGLKMPTRGGLGVAQEPPIKQAIERMERQQGPQSDEMQDQPAAPVNPRWENKVDRPSMRHFTIRLRLWILDLFGLTKALERAANDRDELHRLIHGLRRDLEAIGRTQAMAIVETDQQLDRLETKLGLSRYVTKVIPGKLPMYLLESPAERRTRHAQEARNSRQQQGQSRNRKSRAGSPGGSTATATASRSRT